MLCWIVGAALLVFGEALSVAVVAPIPPIPIAMVESFGGDRGFAAWGLLVVGWLLVSQWMFLRPRRGIEFQLAERGRPLKSAVIAAAFVATLLSAGLVLVWLELAGANLDDWPTMWLELPMLAIWGVWALIFFRWWRRGDRYDQLDRMSRRLLVGSALELLVAVPADVFASRREDCYCARGTYLGIVLGATALVWSFGPGVFLLFLREKVERERKLARPDGPASETPGAPELGATSPSTR